MNTKLLSKIQDQATPVDREEAFREMIRESYSFNSVGGIFAHMDSARVLEEVDPVAFRCGVNDYSDSLYTDEIDGNYYNLSEAETLRDELVNKLESEVSDLEDDIDDLDLVEDAQQIDELQSQVNALKAEIAELNKTVF